MRARTISAVVLAGVALAVIASSASGGTSARSASSITVWLQTDAQAANWQPIVNAVNADFQKAHPGVTVNVQFQTWGNHLQKLDATLAGGNAPDVIEMGNTEMTKYMAAGAFQDLTSDKASIPNSATWLSGLAASGRYGGKLYGVPVLRGLAGRHVSLRPVQEGRHQGADQPRAVHRSRQEARLGQHGEGLLARLHRRHGLVLRDELRLRLRRLDRNPGERQVEGQPHLAEVARRPRRLQGVLWCRLAGEQDDRRDASEPVRRLRPGPGCLDGRAGLVQLLRRRQVQGRDEAVRDAEPHRGPGDARLPRRLGSRSPDRGEQGARASTGSSSTRARRR